MSDAPSIYALVVAMARHMVAGCSICNGTGRFITSTISKEKNAVEVHDCSRCSELLTLLKRVEP